jgi:hypothetical protein
MGSNPILPVINSNYSDFSSLPFDFFNIFFKSEKLENTFLKSPNKKKTKSISIKICIKLVLNIRLYFCDRVYSLMVEHTAHNGNNVGSIPT